jgi:hypothetical protein
VTRLLCRKGLDLKQGGWQGGVDAQGKDEARVWELGAALGRGRSHKEQPGRSQMISEVNQQPSGTKSGVGARRGGTLCPCGFLLKYGPHHSQMGLSPEKGGTLPLWGLASQYLQGLCFSNKS